MIRSWLQQWYALVCKDLRLAWRGGARIQAQLAFGTLVLVLFSFAVGPQPNMLRRLAPSFLWLATLLASVLGLNESMRHETEHGAWEGLRLLGVDARALFLGKAVANALGLVVLMALLLPLSLALFDAELVLGWRPLLPILLLGIGAIAVPGTLYAAMAAQARGGDVLLPLLLFPIVVPGLLAAVRASLVIFAGDPMGELASWRALLVAINLVYWTLCTALFHKVVET